MVMEELLIDEKNMEILKLILDKGSPILYENDQPANMNQVLRFLISCADTMNGLNSDAKKILDLAPLLYFRNEIFEERKEEAEGGGF